MLQIGDGVCVAGDGGAHFETAFRLLIFRPFVEEVCVGTISECNDEGIRVSLGEFFHDVYIPAYWMLRPSAYDAELGLWVWTPDYGEEGGEEGESGGDGGEQRFEMDIGAEIRFKVKAINFTQVTNTAKGVQATTTSTTSRLPPGATGFSSTGGQSSSSNGAAGGGDDVLDQPVRKRSSSVDLSDSAKIPASMHITASICEDGLGLVSWWQNDGGEEELEEEEEEEEGEGYEEKIEEVDDQDEQ